MYVNVYELETAGLSIRRFERDEGWYDYIFQNRSGRGDAFPEDDVILDPIANDTLYNTFGVFTSGLLKKDEALRLLRVGPEYYQLAVKTERALGQLRWLSARAIPEEALRRFHTLAKNEEERYQRALSNTFQELSRFP